MNGQRKALMTAKVKVAALVGLLAGPLGIPNVARAQEVNLASVYDVERANRVTLRTGVEYGFVAGLGYARAVRLLGRPMLFTADANVPWAELDATDYRMRAGLLVPVAFGPWKVAGVLAPALRATKTDLGRMTGVGADLSLTGGYYVRRWFLAAEAGFDWAITTHVAHGDLYRSKVYAEARDGWYAAPGGNLRYGLQAGASFGRHDLVLRVGQVRDLGGDPPLLPIYGTLAFVTRW